MKKMMKNCLIFNLSLFRLVRIRYPSESEALGKLGNIVAETFVILDVSSNVSMFAHPWKHCCGNKICFPGSKNVS
jgi:hypothetical protein